MLADMQYLRILTLYIDGVSDKDTRGRVVDLATTIGILGAWGIVVAAMALGGGVGMFINAPSLLIVCGGSIFVVFMKFNGKQVGGACGLAMKTFFNKGDSITDLITLSTEMANTARKSGLLALESMEINNEFMKKGIQYVIDGLDQEVVHETLLKDRDETVERHSVGQKVFTALADVGPAMGMIGTLVGLVQMLSNMDDPKSIGPSMAVALLTTLYGAMIANMLAGPMADKLALRSKEEHKVKSLMIDAIMGIQGGQNPRLLEEMLKAYLPNKKRAEAGGDGDAGGGEGE